MRRDWALLVALAGLVTACLPAGELISTATPFPTSTPTATASATPRPTLTATPSPTVTSTVPTILIHTVKAGDTLSEIAAFYGVSVARIAEANALGDVHFLSIGQELVIPLADFGPTQPGLRLTPTPRVSSRLCSGLDVYAAADAGQHLEEFACVEFRAATTEVVGEDILLVSPQDAGAVFVVAIDREWQDCWAEGPEARFDDRLVRVRGTIEENLGVPQITLGDCSHIELMPSYGP